MWDSGPHTCGGKKASLIKMIDRKLESRNHGLGSKRQASDRKNQYVYNNPCCNSSVGHIRGKTGGMEGEGSSK